MTNPTGRIIDSLQAAGVSRVQAEGILAEHDAGRDSAVLRAAHNVLAARLAAGRSRMVGKDAVLRFLSDRADAIEEKDTREGESTPPADALAKFLARHPELAALPLKYEVGSTTIWVRCAHRSPRTPEIAETLAAALGVEPDRYENRHDPEDPFVGHEVYGSVSGVAVKFSGYSDLTEQATASVGGEPDGNTD